MNKIWISLFCIIFHNAVFAQTIVWDTNSCTQDLGNKLQVLEDKTGTLAFEQVSSAEYAHQFKQSNKINLNLGYSVSYFWLHLSINNTSGKTPYLELLQAGLPVADLYYKDDNGQTVCFKSGYKIPLNKKMIKNHFQVFPLPAGKHDFYIRLFSNSGPIPVKLFDKDKYEIKSNNEKLLYGFYLGFMFFLMLSNLFFFFSLGNRMYLFYSFNVIIYTCYAVAVVDGFLPYLFPKADLIFWYTTIPTIGVVVQNIYCILFLEVRKYSSGLYRFQWGIIIYFIIYAIIKFALPFPTVLAINTINALISFFMMGFVGFKVGKKGNKMGYYFAFAFFIYFGLVLCEASYIQTGSPAYFTELSHTALSTLAEAFILSFLLSKRFEWEKQAFEKVHAESQQQLLEKTLENERIVREQNVILEQKVEERTHQLTETLDEVKIERQKSERLLHNILPEEIAEELKQYGSSEAKQYDNVSVLFTDFVNFTGISEKVTPKELVAEIDFCYKAFDEIIERNGLEKIKSIGDAYLAVCGLPTPTVSHAENTVNAALEIIDFIKNRKNNGGIFDIRAGINSGIVVAGIVGNKKFAYDIWGDSVNTANRMESNSEMGRLNVSDITYNFIKDKYNCEYRGKIDAKNKGVIDMYFVLSKK